MPKFNLKFIGVSSFAFFLFLHLFLLNVNVAEWGDSYRILRASEILRDFGTYPQDEKRPPAFSALLSLRMEQVDPILMGRVWMLIVSVCSFGVVKNLVEHFFPDVPSRFLAILLFILNPVYLYWSIRIYADVPFALLALGVLTYFTLVVSKKSNFEFKDLVIMGFLTGVAILTRFEGYLLFGSVCIGMLLPKGFARIRVAETLKNGFFYIMFVVITIAPYFLYRNPFDSSYFEEPAGRTYNLNTLWIYIASLTFSLGFVFAAYFVAKANRKIRLFLSKNLHIATFLILELVLALVWPAAIPRLFVPIVPILIILVVIGINDLFATKHKPNRIDLILLASLMLFYVVSQVVLKQQFLVLIKPAFVGVILLQVVMLYSIYFKKYQLFVLTLFGTLSIWSISTIWLHKDLYTSVKSASMYASENLCGKVAYNDVSSVSDWYLNYASKSGCVEGVKLDLTDKKNRELSLLRENHIDYALVTNEHNTDTEVDFEPWPHLREISEYRFNINGKEFFTKIIEIDK